MPVSHTVDEEDGMTRTYFNITPRIAPREVGLAVTQYLIRKSISTGGMTVWCRAQMDKYLDDMLVEIAKCKKVFNRYIVTYREMPKTDHVVVPNIPVKVRGYPGLFIYRYISV